MNTTLVLEETNEKEETKDKNKKTLPKNACTAWLMSVNHLDEKKNCSLCNIEFERNDLMEHDYYYCKNKICKYVLAKPEENTNYTRYCHECMNMFAVMYAVRGIEKFEYRGKYAYANMVCLMYANRYTNTKKANQ